MKFLTILLIYEATERIINKVPVKDPLIMVITAAFGLFCNLVMAKVLHTSPTGDDNHRNLFHQCDHNHDSKNNHHSHNHYDIPHNHSHVHNEKENHKNPQKHNSKPSIAAKAEDKASNVSIPVIDETNFEN